MGVFERGQIVVARVAVASVTKTAELIMAHDKIQENPPATRVILYTLSTLLTTLLTDRVVKNWFEKNESELEQITRISRS